MPAPLDLLPDLLPGVLVTVGLTLGAGGLGLVMALGAGLGSLAQRRGVRIACRVYVELFRGTSALVQLFWVFFALPLVGIQLTATAAAILVLGLNTGAYGAEIVRGSIRAVPPGQFEACTALDLGWTTTMVRVILPQALLLALPPLGNLLIELLKNTALVSLITLSDLTFQAQTLRAETLRTGEIFGLVLVLYLVLALAITVLIRSMERRLSRGRVPGRVS